MRKFSRAQPFSHSHIVVSTKLTTKMHSSCFSLHGKYINFSGLSHMAIFQPSPTDANHHPINCSSLFHFSTLLRYYCSKINLTATK